MAAAGTGIAVDIAVDIRPAAGIGHLAGIGFGDIAGIAHKMFDFAKLAADPNCPAAAAD